MPDNTKDSAGSLSSVDDRLDAALQTQEPARTLRALVTELAGQGYQRDAIYALFERFLLRLRARPDHREADEEVVLDIMDALTGWCHPDARLLADKEG